MTVPQSIFLQFIVDSTNRSLYLENGVSKKSSSPIPIPQHAGGWKDIQISFGTNQTYWSLNRTFTLPMKFVGDAEIIIRDAVYSGKGYEDELYIIILKLNQETGVYELEYKGRLDLGKIEDLPRKGISVNAIEGGVFSLVDANDDVDYEIPLDASNLDAIEIEFDGTNLQDRFRYSIINIDIVKPNDFNHHTVVSTLPFSFISNEGDSIGIKQGSQQYEDAVATGVFTYGLVNSYCAGSANYYLSSINTLKFTLTGKIKFTVFPSGGAPTNVQVFVNTSLGNRYDLLALTAYNSQTDVDIDVNKEIILAPNETAFLMALSASNSINTTHIVWSLQDMFASFQTRVAPSTAYAIQPLPLLKQLVSKMSGGKYTADSNFFKLKSNIVKTSTNALRKFDKAVLVESFKKWFTDYDCVYNIGMKVVGNVIWIEPKADLYNDDSEMLDIGEISNLKIKYAYELLCNTAKFGYKSQDYRQRNGKYEFNTTTLSKLPVNTLKKEYTKICSSRGDCYGIEFIRSLIFDKPSTDTTGDNQSFLVNVKPDSRDDLINVTVTFVSGVNYIYFPASAQFVVGDKINITGSVSNNGGREVIGFFPLIFTTQVVIVAGPSLVDEVGAVINVIWVLSKRYKLNRANYSSITGVLDNTVYNIEEMTPHRMLQAHKNYLDSLLAQLPGQEIVHQTSDKNADLVTTLAGTTISEKQPETVVNDNILFYPFYAEYTTPVPLSFGKIFSNLGTGYITGTFLGQRLYFLPIGKMDGKPATNAAQTWQLLLAPKNELDKIKKLSDEGLFTTDIMGNTIFTSDLNALHFNKYNYTLPAKYQHKEMYDDHFHNRTEDYISKAFYCQKWQKTEKIPIQAITSGLGTVTVEVYNAEGILHFSAPMNIVADSAVLLPYIKNNYELIISGYPDGIYFVVLSSGGKKLRISEYLDIKQKHEKTLLLEYGHTTNKFNTYFTDLQFQLRVEATLLPWYPDSSFESYTDELYDVELLDGVSYGKRNLRLGNSAGIPDWMALKVSRILLLNRSLIDGVKYSRTPESKFTRKEISGHPMSSYLIEILNSVNNNGLGTNEDGTQDDIMIAYTLDAKAFGIADPGAVINIEVPLI
jgi:hypothetical protein